MCLQYLEASLLKFEDQDVSASALTTIVVMDVALFISYHVKHYSLKPLASKPQTAKP